MALNSANVKVFPSAYRGEGYDPEAHLSSEKNLATITKSLSRYDGFVISWSSPNIEFVLGGYHFEVTLTATELTGDNIYAHIKVGDRHTPTAGGKDWACTSLLTTTGGTGALDDNNEFKGLVIDNTPTQSGFINLLLLYKDGTSYVVPDESKVKIKAEDVGCSYTVSGNTVTTPISDIFVTQGAWIAGNGGFNVGPAVLQSKFSVQASSGNTAIAGTLGVTGATTLTSATLSSTLSVTGTSTFTGAATFNGTSTFNDNVTISSHDLTVTGDISCVNLDAGQQVSCDGLLVDQIGSGSNTISLGRTLLPSSDVNLGSGSNLFNIVYSKELYLINGANYIDISCSSSTWSIAVDGACNFLTSGILTIGRSGQATATFRESDVTFNKTIKSSATGSTLAIDVTDSNTGKIKCKELEATTQINATKIIGNTQSGTSVGNDAKIYYGVGSGTGSVTVVGNAIYVFTITNGSNSYSATMMFTNNAASNMHSHLYMEGSQNMLLKATKNSGTDTWTVKLYAEGTEQTSASIEYAQIAKLA